MHGCLNVAELIKAKTCWSDNQGHQSLSRSAWGSCLCKWVNQSTGELLSVLLFLWLTHTHTATFSTRSLQIWLSDICDFICAIHYPCADVRFIWYRRIKTIDWWKRHWNELLLSVSPFSRHCYRSEYGPSCPSPSTFSFFLIFLDCMLVFLLSGVKKLVKGADMGVFFISLCMLILVRTQFYWRRFSIFVTRFNWLFRVIRPVIACRIWKCITVPLV
jgi:hypothetical protein